MTDYKKKEGIFPSFYAMSRKIQKEECQQLSEKLNKITKKVDRLKSKANFDQQHRELAKKLINDYKMETIFEGQNFEKYTELYVSKGSSVPLKNTQSLNEYLDNSEQEQNNYEAHLKFRKKALERQLEENEDDQVRKSSKIKKNKQNAQEDQMLFLKLYQPTREQFFQKDRNSKKSNQDKYSTLKQNKKKLIETFPTYLQILSDTNVVKWRILNEQSK